MDVRSWEIPHIALSERKTIVFIDFETTGFVPWKAARIIEYSAIKVTPTENVIFHTLAKPYAFSAKSPINIPYKITDLTKITNEMVEDAPDTFSAFREFHKFIDGHICIAHNAKFEQSFVQWYCDFLGLKNNSVFRDTLPMFKAKYKVGALSKITQSENAHMAFDDCVSMIRLMKECQEDDPKLLNLCEIVNLSEDTRKSIFESIRPNNRARMS
jgi:DNA polymerase-3 subunit alpha (Gram-positive type)